MTVRLFRTSDIDALKAMAEACGYPYPDPAQLELVHVVVDDDDKPVMAAGAKRILELYLWTKDFERPLAQIHAIRALHGSMNSRLIEMGYEEVNAFLPPEISSRFGRRLERSFGWRKNWPSWCKKLWRDQ